MPEIGDELAAGRALIDLGSRLVQLGYGFPIGGVAATDVAAGGVVSAGGVGFDISCGVRLLAADLDLEALTPRLDPPMDQLDHAIPRGLGRGPLGRLTGRSQLEEVLADGSRYAVKRGHGTARDLERCEDQGAVADAGATAVSARAQQRGLGQLGSLGRATTSWRFKRSSTSTTRTSPKRSGSATARSA